MAVVTQAARFCGHVDKSNPDRDRLEEYTVTQGLADVEARIASQKITEDSLKIKEALILVSTDFGNAHSVLTGAGFAELKTFEEFKEECYSFWKPTGKKYKLLNICKFLCTSRRG